MKVLNVAKILGGLSLLKYFPADDIARQALLEMVMEMAHTEDQVRWLVSRMTNGLYSEWPGPKELRACFCSRFPPRDGINAYSDVFPDGIPSERGGAEEPWKMQIPAGATRTALALDAPPEYREAIEKLAAAKSMKPARRIGPQPTNPGYKPITQADVDRVVREKREAAARAELG